MSEAEVLELIVNAGPGAEAMFQSWLTYKYVANFSVLAAFAMLAAVVIFVIARNDLQ